MPLSPSSLLLLSMPPRSAVIAVESVHSEHYFCSVGALDGKRGGGRGGGGGAAHSLLQLLGALAPRCTFDYEDDDKENWSADARAYTVLQWKGVRTEGGSKSNDAQRNR